MSELTNRAAYLKGLADGMKIDKEKDEAKLLAAIIDFLGDIADKVDAIDDEQGFIADELDDVEEAVDVLGNVVFGEYDDDFEYDYDDDDDTFQICCQGCGEEICLASEDLMDGEILCPNCGDTIEFDFDCDGMCEDCDGCDEE